MWKLASPTVTEIKGINLKALKYTRQKHKHAFKKTGRKYCAKNIKKIINPWRIQAEKYHGAVS